MTPSQASEIPILLLKTQSTPTDAYSDLFSTNPSFNPRFVPVLQHRFLTPGLTNLQSLIRSRSISNDENAQFGGLIFTSQRAVEAFTQLHHDDQGATKWSHLKDVPVYSVGPATTRALRAIDFPPDGLKVFGEETGNGEALAHYILEHYHSWYPNRDPKPGLFFPVGEQRRDIIPKTLMDEKLSSSRRIHVHEEIVYGTGVMESFPEDFGSVLEETKQAEERWVVVFSPTGCDHMLKGLGLLDVSTGRAIPGAKRDGRTFIVTIGPTTQAYLRETFGFEPDVCAEKPSPEGILQGIEDFKSKRQS